MIQKIGIIVIINIIIGATIYSGCLQTATGQLVLKITDDPDLNITNANVTITKVEVHRSAMVNNTTAGWFSVVNESQTFDLIALQNVSQILGEVNLSVGKYTQIRLYINKTVLTIDGMEFECLLPSTVIKLINPFTISADETTTLVLDFNVQQSVHEVNNDTYMFTPTIKIIQQ